MMAANSRDETLSWFNANTAELLSGKETKNKTADIYDEFLNVGEANSTERLQQRLDAELKAHVALATLEAAQRAGVRLRNPLKALEFSSWLFSKRSEHRCSSLLCQFFHIPTDMLYWSPYSHRRERSSGIVYVCRQTGASHLCGQLCDTAVYNEEEGDGYICAISGRFLGQFFDNMPQGKGLTMTRPTIDRYEKANAYGRSERGCYDDNDGDSEGDSKDYVENEPIRKKTDQEKREDEKKQKRLERKRREHEAAGLLGTEIVDSESEIESSDNEDDWIRESEKETAKITDEAEQARAAGAMPGIPKGSGELARVNKPAGNTTTTPRGTGSRIVFDLPSDPDERTAHFLRNPEQRRIEIDRLLTVLLTFTSHASLWEHLAEQESERAHAQFPSFVKRQGGRLISYSEHYAYWLAHMAAYAPPQPRHQKPLNLTPYRNFIMKAWWIIANAPYARIAERTRIVPNLTNLSLGVLYTMIEGPLNLDCSINESILPNIPLQLAELDLRDFYVSVLPSGRTVLSRYLLAKELIKEMPKVTMKRYKLSIPKKAKGIRCFRDALTSSVEHFRDQLRADLAKSKWAEDAVVIAVLEYVARCRNLMCTIPVEETSTEQKS